MEGKETVMEKFTCREMEAVRKDGCGFEYEATQGEDGMITIYMEDGSVERFPSAEAAEAKYRLIW